MVRVWNINIWKYKFTITFNKQDDFGDLVATIDIKEKGVLVSLHNPINPKAELLAYSHSEQFTKDWVKMSEIPDEKFIELKNRAIFNIQNGVKFPISDAISTIGLNNDLISSDYR